MCPYLFALQSFLWGPVGVISDDPLVRLGLKDACCNNLKLVACTFSAYHNLKFNYAARFHSGGDLDPSVEIPAFALKFFHGSFANVFRAEAMELGLNTRCFDPDAFNSYLAGQSAVDDDTAADLSTLVADSSAHAASLSLDSTAAHSAPGSSSSRAGRSAFVRATQTNAHNPILHPSIDPDGYHITLSNDPDENRSRRVGPRTTVSTRNGFVRATSADAHNPIISSLSGHHSASSASVLVQASAGPTSPEV